MLQNATFKVRPYDRGSHIYIYIYSDFLEDNISSPKNITTNVVTIV
jgi:hypothetical protein